MKNKNPLEDINMGRSTHAIEQQVDNMRRKLSRGEGSPVNLMMERELYLQMKVVVLHRGGTMRDYIEDLVRADLNKKDIPGTT